METEVLKQHLEFRIREVCQWLLPAGKENKRGEWRVGDIYGTPAQRSGSFSVMLEGEHTGVWTEFATGETGDLFSLYMEQNSCDFNEAKKAFIEFLGDVPAAKPVPEMRPKQLEKKFERPGTQGVTAAGKAVKDYLKGRGLSDKTIEKYRIAQGKKGNHPPHAIFPYLKHEDGKLVLISYKHLVLEREDGRKIMWQSDNPEPCLFGHQTVGDERILLLTEGEIDAMTAYEYRMQSHYTPDVLDACACMSLPLGSGKDDKQSWIEYEWHFLDRFAEIYLVMDDDGPGRDTIPELVNRLGRHRVRIVTLPGEGKDINEQMKNGLKREQLVEAMKEAINFQDSHMATPSDFRAEVHELFRPTPGTDLGFCVMFPSAQHIRFHPSGLCVWSGVNESGKTKIINMFVVVHGITPGPHQSLSKPRRKIGIFELEEPPAETINGLVSQITGEELPSVERIDAAIDYMKDHVYIYPNVEVLSADTLVKLCEYQIMRYGVDQIIIDSLARINVREEDLDTVKKDVMNALVQLTQKYGVTVHLVVHQRKPENEYADPSKQGVRGTGAIIDLAHQAFFVARNVWKERVLEAVEMREAGEVVDLYTARRWNAPKSDTGEIDWEAVLEFAIHQPDTKVIVGKARKRGSIKKTLRAWYNYRNLQIRDTEDYQQYDYLRGTDGRI